MNLDYQNLFEKSQLLTSNYQPVDRVAWSVAEESRYRPVNTTLAAAYECR